MSAGLTKSIPYKELAAGAIAVRGQQKHLFETTSEPSLKPQPGQFATPGATERLPEANNVTHKLPALKLKIQPIGGE